MTDTASSDASTKNRNPKDLESKVDDLAQKIRALTDRLDHIERSDIPRIDILAQKFEENVRDTAKAITQLTEALEAQKDKFKSALTATHNLDARTLNEFKKNHGQQISTITTSIQSLKDEIDKLKNANPESSDTQKQSDDGSPFLARLELLENKTTSQNDEINKRIEEISQDIKTNIQTTENLSSKLSEFDTQYSLDCQQRREHDTEFDSELSKMKLSIEANETEIKNQTDLITKSVNQQITDKLDSTERKILDFDSNISQKLDNQKTELQEMISKMKEEILADSTSQDQLKSELQQQADEQRKGIEQLIKEQIDAVQLDENKKIDDLRSQIEFVTSVKADLMNSIEESKQSLETIVNSNTSKIETLSSELTEKVNYHDQKINEILKEKEDMDKFKADTSSRIDSINSILKKNETELQQDINDFNSKMQDIQAKTGSVTTEASQNLQSQIDQLKKEQEDQKNLINDLSSKQSDSQSSILHGIEPRLAIIETQLTELNSSVIKGEDLDKKLNDRKSEIDSQISQLKTEIEQSIKSVQSNLNTEGNSLEDVKSQLNALNEQIQEITSTQKSLSPTVTQSDFDDYMKKNEENINTFNSRLDELQQKNEENINTFNSRLDELQQKNSESINGFDSRLDELQQKNEENMNTFSSRLDELQQKNNEMKSTYDTQIKEIQENLTNDLKSKVELIENHIQSQSKDVLTKSEEEQNEMKSQLEAHITEIQEKVSNDMKSKLESIDQITKEIQTKVDSIDSEVKAFKDEYQKNVDSTADIIADTVNSIKTSHDQTSSEIEEVRNNCNGVSDKVNTLEDNFDEVKQTANTCMSNFNDLNATMYDKFVTSDALESINAKRKNLEDSMRTIIGELNGLIQTEKTERTANIEDITHKLNDMQSTIQDTNNKVELNASYNKEQIRTVMKIIQSTQNEDGNNSGAPTASPEMIEELNELQYKVRLIEESNSKFKEDIVGINKALIDFKNDFKKHEKMITEQDFVNNGVHDDIYERISAIERRTTETFEKLEDLPKMVHKASDDNQLAINELSHHVEEKLRDFDSQMKQADFADEEIEELRKQLEGSIENWTSTTASINERIEKSEKEIEKRKSAEDELSKIWAAIKDNKLKLDVQLDRTNPQFSKLIQELRMKVFPQDEMSSESQIQMPENTADIEMLKAKVGQLEEDLRNTTVTTTHLKDDISITQDNLERTTTQMRNEIKDNNKKLIEMFVNQETFNGMKNEVKTIFNLLNTTIENSENDKENLEEEMNGFRTDIQNVRNEIQALSQNGAITPNEAQREVKPTAEIGAERTSSSASFNQKGSSDKRFGELQQKIEGIDSALQQQIRKLKSSIRKIEKAFEDAEEEEKRQQEIERQKKRKEEEEKRRKEEEEMMEEEYVDDITLDNQNQQIVSTGNQNLVRPAEAVVYVEGGDSTEVEKLPQKIGTFMTTVKLPTAVELIQDDFQIFFVLMFSVLLYFLISDLFLS